MNFSFSICGYITGSKHRDGIYPETDDQLLRPPIWDDITSSIQNIDPENAVMLGSIVTQVKLESNDEQLLESLSSSPLLSPLEIKTEKYHNNNNNSGISNNNTHHQQQQQQQISPINSAQLLQHNVNINQNLSSNSTTDNNSSTNCTTPNNNLYNMMTGTNYHCHQQHTTNGSTMHGGYTNNSGNGCITNIHPNSQAPHPMQNNNSSYYNYQNHAQVNYDLESH